MKKGGLHLVVFSRMVIKIPLLLEARKTQICGMSGINLEI